MFWYLSGAEYLGQCPVCLFINTFDLSSYQGTALKSLSILSCATTQAAVKYSQLVHLGGIIKGINALWQYLVPSEKLVGQCVLIH